MRKKKGKEMYILNLSLTVLNMLNKSSLCDNFHHSQYIYSTSYVVTTYYIFVDWLPREIYWYFGKSK